MSDLATSKPACDVCKDTSCARGNLLLHCTGSDCTVVVHKNCYGVKQTSTTSWKCAPCAAGLKTEELRCVLCSRTGGPYKQVGEANEKGGYKLTDSWAHVLCALWVPETYFGNADTMEPVLGVQTIDPDRFLMCCVACHKVKQGACVQCRFGNCTVGLHPTCVSLRKSTSVGVALPSGNAPDEYALVMYCNVHAYRGRQAGYVLDPTVVQQPIAPLFVRKTAPVFAPLKDKLPSGFKLSQPNKPVTAFAGPKKPGRRAKVGKHCLLPFWIQVMFCPSKSSTVCCRKCARGRYRV